MASLRKRGKIYYARYYVNGKQKAVCLHTSSYPMAKQKLRKIESKLAIGADSPNTPLLQRWGIKTKTNDELRQMFVNRLVPELHLLGLSIPDPDLRYDEETGNWIHGPIDWDEFKRVINGGGPCSKQRLDARRKAHDDGWWVREALAAYARRERAAV